MRAITVENLSKSFQIHHARATHYQTLREALVRGTRDLTMMPLRWLKGTQDAERRDTEEFWALNDISFDITEGDRIGIIGRNGAGKSTLLKVLSRITAPTKGRITIRGRMSSLLEVGTGFHPELTGRENIFLNGAILGMSHAEMRQKFDEIVDFAEVEQFLDTPVKRYSSGMYVRLAFAVAAHLEPDILVVDEVLAVGDVAFQKKCLARMNEVGSNGRTVLFVSHNVNAVEQLCNSVLILDRGRLVQNTRDVNAAIRQYMSGSDGAADVEWRNDQRRFDNEWFVPTRFYIGDETGLGLHTAPNAVNEPTHVYVEGTGLSANPALQIGIAVYSEDGAVLFWSYCTDDEEGWVAAQAGENRFRVKLPPYFLNEGVYRIELVISLYHQLWICQPGKNAPAITLTVQGGFLASRYWAEKRPGLLAPRLTWKG
jgi:lipopolysaccharide transport system ATP-binding protein